MEGSRAARIGELDDVIGLINRVFRTECGYSPTMANEFPLLLCSDNIENIRVITDKNEPVATASYYKSRILVQSCYINAGSVGSVCTDSNYRGKKLASMLMDDIEEKMKSDNIDVALISGRINLYLRRACSIVGNFSRAMLECDENLLDGNTEITEYSKEYAGDMYRLYNMEPVRFYRTRYEYENLFKGATFDCCIYSYRTFLLKRHKSVIGYAVVRRIDTEGWAEIVEMAGNREAIYKNLRKIASLCGVKKIQIKVPDHDPVLIYAKGDGAEIVPDLQCGTVKIINFEKLMNNLKPYFAQYLLPEVVDKLVFRQNGEQYEIKTGEESLVLSDLNTLNQVVFGFSDAGDKMQFERSLQGKEKIKRFIDSVFPIPMPSAYNMNYI